MPWIILAIIISYLIGSIPVAYIFGRALKGIDIRQYGSGNVGATNALRVLGKPAGIGVLALDIFKGFIAVFFLGNFAVAKTGFLSEEALRIILGLTCITGHNWTIFLKFKGGKGVATTLGVLLGLGFKIPGLMVVLSLVILTWLLAFLFLRIVSLASVISALGLPIYMLCLRQSSILIASSFLLALFIILRHKSNFKRIFQGKERRVF
jgi:glycerol-3-phosphate acyltransferase PlsY